MSEQDIRDIKESVAEIQAAVGELGDLRVGLVREIKEGVTEIRADVGDLWVGLARVEEHVKRIPVITEELRGHQRRLSRLEGIGTFAGLIVATVLTWFGFKR